MIYKFVLLLCMMDPTSEPQEEDVVEIRKETDWPVGCWNSRAWGGMRLLEDGYAIDTDPEGRLNNWGIWQYYCSDDAVIIVWMESNYDEVIQKNNDKYFMQSLWCGDMSSKVEEVKKVGK